MDWLVNGINMKENQHIDIVIAWVDGADPIHKNKRLKFLNKSQEIILPRC